MKRRTFLVGAATSLASPLAARAQQPKVHKLAVVDTGRTVAEMTENGHPVFRAFFGELRSLGYVEGANLAVTRWSGSAVDETRYDEFARAVVATKPDLIASNGARLMLSFKRATDTIPIVMTAVTDPVAWGVVDRLSRQGGNITGFARDGGIEEIGKRVQFLLEAAPDLRTMAYFGTPATWDGPGAAIMRDLGQKFSLPVVPALVEGPVTPDAVRRTLLGIQGQPRIAVVTAAAVELLAQRQVIAEAAIAAGLLIIAYDAADARAGILMSYASRSEDLFRRAAGYVNRVFNGANPGDLPVQLPTVYDFAINLNTAKALGLTIPEQLLALATEVIE
jgi:putative tryptophan/tyrosine transport system substrate-binding protein